MDTIRAIYILANHHTQPDLHKEVDEGLRLLPLHRTTLQRRRRTRAIVECAPHYILWLPYWRKRSFCPPLPSRVAAHQPLPHRLSPLIRLPDQATLPQPSPMEDNSRRQPTDARIWKRQKLSTLTPHHFLNSNTPPRSQPTKNSCKALKRQLHIRKQTTNPYSLTKKINTLAAAVRKISNVVCALQHQVCTLSNENVSL